MWFKIFFKPWNSTPARRQSLSQRPPASRPRLEALEDRSLLNFSPVVSYPVEWDAGAVVTADFNDDGRLDLAVANASSNTVSVLLGNGEGTFQSARTSSTGVCHGLVAGDLNDDGMTDLVTFNDSVFESNGELSVLLSNGDSTFQPPQTVVLPPQFPPGYTGPTALDQGVSSVALGDLNGDGKLDLVATGATRYEVIYGYGDNGEPLYIGVSDFYVNVLPGNGDATFLPGIVYHDIYLGKVDLGDFNNDGRLDVAYDGGASVSVRLGNGDGTLQTAQRSYVSAWSFAHSVGDFNGDGKLDLLMQDGTGNAVVPVLGNGDGTYRPTEPIFVGTIHGATVSDVNADHKLDIVTVDSNYDEYGVVWTSSARVLLGRGDGTFSPPVTSDLATSPGKYFGSLVMADFDGDGLPDLAGSASDNFDNNQGFVAVAHNDGIWDGSPPLLPSIAIGDVTVTEGNAATSIAQFTVTLSAASTETITVEYTTASGTATAGSDYQAASDTLTFVPGETSKAVTVLVNGDRLPEPNETFFVNLGNSTNAIIADAQGVGTIVDDEPRISIDDVTKTEGKKNKITKLTFLVTLSAAYDQPVTMSFHTVNGTATTGNNDYVGQSGTLTFAPGERTKKITIEVNGDGKREADEFFYLDLFGNSGNSLFTKYRGIGTIVNDD